MITSESAFRQAERRFAGNPDGLWEFLEEHKHEEPTLCIGWAIERARRYYNYDQATIADHTAIFDTQGNLIEAAISKSFVSAMLSARSRVSPEVYKRLARAYDVNVIEFHIAEGWEDLADIMAYNELDQEVAHPIIQRILALPVDTRPRAVGVMTAVLESIVDIASTVGASSLAEAHHNNGSPRT
jgi:hypothetical protein